MESRNDDGTITPRPETKQTSQFSTLIQSEIEPDTSEITPGQPASHSSTEVVKVFQLSSRNNSCLNQSLYSYCYYNYTMKSEKHIGPHIMIHNNHMVSFECNVYIKSYRDHMQQLVAWSTILFFDFDLLRRFNIFIHVEAILKHIKPNFSNLRDLFSCLSF